MTRGPWPQRRCPSRTIFFHTCLPYACFAHTYFPYTCFPRTRFPHPTAVGEEVAGIEDYVVAFAVAVGAGGAEAEVGGFEDEGEFGEFSAALGVDFALAGSLGDRLLLGGLGSDRLLSDKLRARR